MMYFFIAIIPKSTLIQIFKQGLTGLNSKFSFS